MTYSATGEKNLQYIYSINLCLQTFYHLLGVYDLLPIHLVVIELP